MTNNTLANVGLGKRNKSNASVYLHGVQVTNIDSNTFVKSAPIVIEHTVGEPNTLIVNNTFDSTDEPSVTELRVAGPHTATLKNNKVIKN